MATLPGDAVLRPMKYPVELAGTSNGKLPSSILVTIPFPGGGSGVFSKTAARAFAALLDAMHKVGFRMMTVGGYRTYEQQVTLFTSRYYIVSYDSGIFWNGHYWVKRTGVAQAAIPGTSNHGWGLADDLAENLDSDTGIEDISQAAVDWLVKNADRFGISAELRSEAWHWRYYRGDDVPQAVLDYEAGAGGKDVALMVVNWPDEKGVYWATDLVRRRRLPDSSGLRSDMIADGVVFKTLDVDKVPSGWTREQYLTGYAGPVDTELGGGTAGVTEHSHDVTISTTTTTGPVKPQG